MNATDNVQNDESTTDSTTTTSKPTSVRTIAEIHDETVDEARTRLWASNGAKSWGDAA